MLNEAFDAVRKRVAIKRRKNVSYSLIARVGYEKIQKLKKDGFSYDIICEVFVENRLLPDSANPKSLCVAFLREKKRRERKAMSAPNDQDTKENRPGVQAKFPQRATLSSGVPAKPQVVAMTATGRTGVEINPDNTFKIRPIDPEDLP
jgi:hypothetical protein